MAETSGRIPKVVRGGEAAPGTGAVVPGERMELPFALECARQKVLICIAPGQSPVKGDSGKPKSVDTWLGVSMGAVDGVKELLAEEALSSKAAGKTWTARKFTIQAVFPKTHAVNMTDGTCSPEDGKT